MLRMSSGLDSIEAMKGLLDNCRSIAAGLDPVGNPDPGNEEVVGEVVDGGSWVLAAARAK